MDRTAEKYAIIFAYFLIYVVWGSTYYFIGVALEGFPTFVLGAARFGIAGPYCSWHASCAARKCSAGGSFSVRR